MRQNIEKILAKHQVPRFEYEEGSTILRTDKPLSAAILAELKSATGGFEFRNEQLRIQWELDQEQPERREQVNHPRHYNAGKIEVIEFLEDQFMDRPHEWTAVKYLARAPHKANEIEDLEKAVWYIQRKIERLKAAKEGRDVTRPNDMNARVRTRKPKVDKKVEMVSDGEETAAPIQPVEGDWITVEVEGKEQIAFVPKLMTAAKLPKTMFAPAAGVA
jgi:hypothetical protein